jgi:hypothetical protein
MAIPESAIPVHTGGLVVPANAIAWQVEICFIIAFADNEAHVKE